MYTFEKWCNPELVTVKYCMAALKSMSNSVNTSSYQPAMHGRFVNNKPWITSDMKALFKGSFRFGNNEDLRKVKLWKSKNSYRRTPNSSRTTHWMLGMKWIKSLNLRWQSINPLWGNTWWLWWLYPLQPKVGVYDVVFKMQRPYSYLDSKGCTLSALNMLQPLVLREKLKETSVNM